ncbi:MAG: hypothetical protein KJO21_03140 [Verrucomicrobiae bacterium]|nr:hypothetical protein [Verrucomicrobiae bacterium]NNJ41912.1 hypothetical protein [Akkermansiaceae bacterium]
MSSLFNSHETGDPFSHCCDCGCELSHASMHVVNQSYVGDECVFEFAMCLDCREKMNAKLSEQSRVAMFDFMHDHADMESREQELGDNSETEAYISHCLTCGKPRQDSPNFTLGAMFSGNNIIKGPFPMLICGTCEETLAATISDETRNVWDKFIGEKFPGPPSEVTLPTGHQPVLI